MRANSHPTTGTTQRTRPLLYEVTGAGDPIVLVLVPGILSGWASWISPAERLARKHKVVRAQLRGVELVGPGEPFPDDYSVAMERDALLVTVDAIGLSLGAAAERLTADADARRLDPAIVQAVQAVLSVAGHPSSPRHHAWPADLTDREVQVPQLAARGLSKKEIGAQLFISPKTADHHIQHIYARIGVSTRAGAAMFAMQHDLVQTHPA